MSINGGPFSAEEARAALEHADPNLLRIALLQLTGDPSLKRMGVEKVFTGPYVSNQLNPEHHDEVRAKTLAWLCDRPDTALPPPDKAAIRELMRIFANRELSDADFLFGYEELGFEDYPRDVGWTTKPSAEKLGDFHVTIVGAGLSGIAMAIQLNRLGIPYTIYEREQGPGGTWLINTYPDFRCDIICFNYQFKFEKNYPWKSYFPTQPECLEYLEYVAGKYGVLDHCRFGEEVVAAAWDDKAAKWDVTTRSDKGETTTRSNVIVSGAGTFSTPNLPDIPDIERFQGAIFHTAKWDHSVDYRGKRVAVIGNGSSSTQLTPHLGETAAYVAAFQRTPQWIAPLENYHGKVSSEVKWLADNLPYYWNWQNYSAFLFSMQIQEFQEIEPGRKANGGGVSAANDHLRETLTEYIESKVGDDPELMAKLLPSVAPLGRRLVIDNGWYDTLRRDNVELITDGIERFTETGIRTVDGVERAFDLVVLGTGFNTSKYLWPTHYVGRDGTTLDDLWSKDGPRSYLGITLPGFPNFFAMFGPNGQPRAAGLHSWMEAWTRYILTAVTKMVEGGHSSVELRRDVYDDYNAQVDRVGATILWAQEGKGSYYVNAYGRSDLNIPFRAEEYYAMISSPNMDYFILN